MVCLQFWKAFCWRGDGVRHSQKEGLFPIIWKSVGPITNEGKFPGKERRGTHIEEELMFLSHIYQRETRRGG